MSTYADLIKRALKTAQIVGEGAEPSAEQAADAMDTMNEMLSSWNTDSLALYQTTNDVVTLTPGQSVYTVGIGGNFSVDRPSQINAVYVDYQGVSFPIYETTQEEFNLITLKGLTQILPRFFLYLNTYPMGTFSLWPIPQQALTLTFTVDRVIPEFALADTASLPPGYEKAIRLNLACELCQEYGMQVSPFLMKTATEAFANVKRANRTPAMASTDPALLSQPGGIAGFLSGY